jgi:hypothetical protein
MQAANANHKRRCTAYPNTVHLAEIPVSFGGAGFSLRRTSVRLLQAFTSFEGGGLKPGVPSGEG